ncbi:MAG: hypothetical protein ONB55_22580 [candidate division KSB1 bacterium]|nr:hypothetical protein [candidate division KSB1 bacterium]
MKAILIALIIELITALLLEALRNIEISADPPSLETRLGPVGIRIDLNDVRFLHGLQAWQQA